MLDTAFAPLYWIQNMTTSKNVRWIMALVVALLSIVDWVTVLFPIRPGRLALLFSLINAFAPFVPSGGIFVYTGKTIILLLGFFLLLVAFGLVKGKERAWQCAAVLLPLSALGYLLKGLSIEPALIIIGIWGILLRFRVCFRVESDPWRMHQGVAFLGLGGVLLLIYLLGGYLILQKQFFILGMEHAVEHALLRRVVGLPSHRIIPETHSARWFFFSIPWLSSAVLLTGMVLLLRPVSSRWWLNYQQEKNEQMHAKAWELIKTFGIQTMAFFALDMRNIRYIAPGGEGVVSYQLVGDTAVVVGDPVAALEARERILKQFLNLCALKDWNVAIYQARADYLPIYRKLGLTTIKIGEEAFLYPQTFLLKGSAMANVRTSARRAEREGVSLDWYEGEPPQEVLSSLRELSQNWLRNKGGKQSNEMGFSMGRLSELREVGKRSEQIREMVDREDEEIAPPHLMLVIARTQAGVPCAFMSFTPIYGQVQIGESGKKVRSGWGWALDLMRRTPEAPPGVMELLIVQAVERFRAAGAELLSLGMVGLADTRQETSPGQQNLARLATEHIQLLETHRSLQRFKQKFQPTWESRYVVASSTLALPKVGIALLRAHQR